jgi:predicted ATPase with chaperone activity
VKLPHLPKLDRHLVIVLRSTVKELKLSARAYARILIMARGIADWAKAERIEAAHLFEAIQICTLRGD